MIPASGEAAKDVMREVITKSQAEEGCLEYCYAVDVLVPSLIHVFEIWQDKDSLDAPLKTPHLKAWRESWSSFGTSDRKLSLVKVASTTPL